MLLIHKPRIVKEKKGIHKKAAATHHKAIYRFHGITLFFELTVKRPDILKF